MILLCDDECVGCIVEVEVYVGDQDLVVYLFCGMILCMCMMFGEVGYLYVYFIYGMYWGVNVVCGDIGQGWGVLLWVLVLLVGIDWMCQVWVVVWCDCDLVSGLGCLLQVLGIIGVLDGIDLIDSVGFIWIVSDGMLLFLQFGVGLCIGICCVMMFFWCWYVFGNDYVFGCWCLV